MILFHRLWITMKQKGVSADRLWERCGIDSKTIGQLKANGEVETDVLNRLCQILNCGLEEIVEYRPDDDPA